MTSLAGCSGESFASILRALGYVPEHRKGPAITVALRAPRPDLSQPRSAVWTRAQISKKTSTRLNSPGWPGANGRTFAGVAVPGLDAIPDTAISDPGHARPGSRMRAGGRTRSRDEA